MKKSEIYLRILIIVVLLIFSILVCNSQCINDSDCDDNNNCTIDFCLYSINICRYLKRANERTDEW